jgi:hypothetical protein
MDRVIELEKDLDTSTQMFPLIKEHFVEWKGFFTTVMVYWDKRKAYLLQLGAKVIKLND